MKPPAVCDALPCRETQLRRYLNGWFCASHTPAAMAGHAEPHGQDASWIGRSRQTLPGARGGSDINKERPGGYVSRQKAARIAATRDALRGDS